MIEVSYILHNLDQDGNRLDLKNQLLRKDMFESEQACIDAWAYLSRSEVEIRSTRELTQKEVDLKNATARRIAQDYRTGVYNGD